MPKAARDPRGAEISEQVFIENVEAFLEELLSLAVLPTRQLRKDAETLIWQSAQVHSQVRRGVHTNPAGSQYQVSDRVRVKAGARHDDMSRGKTGTIRQISSPALAVQFDGMAEIHKWYVDAEVERADLRSNPGELVIFGNPPIKVGRGIKGLTGQVMPPIQLVGLIGDSVHQLKYRHADDGKPYVHDFEDAATGLWAATTARWGRMLVIFNANGVPLWQDFT